MGVRRRTRRSSVSAAVVASVLAVSALLLPSPATTAVQAHCPGGALGHWYAFGHQTPGVTMNGIAATIEWTQGNICSSGVSHSVSVANAAGTAWAQVGWRYWTWMSEPMMYCEWQGGQYKIQDFSITHASHRYKVVYDTVDKYWDCSIDNVVKYSYSGANANFSGGSLAVAQGEAHQPHVQIGRNAPAKLAFTDMQYRKQSDGSWPAFNVTLDPADVPCGEDKPVVGQIRVWTNPH